MTDSPTPEETDKLLAELQAQATAGGYNLNPDIEFTRDLVEALLINTRRYGYRSCPCRLADGDRTKDLDIICPCDYRDPDLADYGSCYCALYVSDVIAKGDKEAEPIPERRGKTPDAGTRGRGDTERQSDSDARTHPSTGSGRAAGTGDLEYPVWRCPVCGYLCAREHPPEKCPVCKADKDRFQRFL